MRKGLKIVLGIVLFFQVIRILSGMGISLFGLPSWMGISDDEDRISEIDIQVHLDSDGSATILERRRMILSEGTEVTIELSDLGPSELLDFYVEDFEEDPNWDKDVSFDEKAFKYGVFDGESGPELAWGISEYGYQEYWLSYTLSNVVRELDDGQALFWNFDSFLTLPTERMSLQVFADPDTDIDLIENLEAFDGYGFKGSLDLFEDTVLWTGENLHRTNDLNLLLQFTPNTFQTDAQVDMTLAAQREMALKGSTYNEAEPMSQRSQSVIKGLVIAGIGIVGSGVAYVFRRRRIRKKNNHFNPYQLMAQNKEHTGKLPSKVEGDLANYAALILRLAPAGAGFTNLFAAYLLFWEAIEMIRIEVREERKAFRRTENTIAIQLANFDPADESKLPAFAECVELFEQGESSFEEVMWGILLRTADADGIIEGATLEEWLKKNEISVDRLIASIKPVSTDWLVENYYLKMYSIGKWGFPIAIEELTPEGEELALKIVHYHNFIRKYGLLS